MCGLGFNDALCRHLLGGIERVRREFQETIARGQRHAGVVRGEEDDEREAALGRLVCCPDKSLFSRRLAVVTHDNWMVHAATVSGIGRALRRLDRQ
ncbi:MAG: hypothetical protein M3460_18920 [Actinomycetota bacterium]|nr:hypothetical protein [Actinomycetota bacterium]